MTDTKSTDHDDISLSSNPFSEDHEITMMEKMSVSDIDTLDETNEITEKSFVNRSQVNSSGASVPSTQNVVRHIPQPQKVSTTPGPTPQFKRAALIVTVPVALFLFLGSVYVFNVLIPQWTKPTKPPVVPQQQLSNDLEKLFGPQDHNIQLSELTVDDAEADSGNLPSVYIAGTLRLHFSLLNWQIPVKKPILNFRVAVKIFDQYGKLLLSQPSYKTYSENAVAKDATLLIENEIRVLPNTPLGIYSVRFDVIDESSQKSKTLQTQFRVLSRQPIVSVPK